MEKKEKSAAESIGTLLAIVQSGFDDLFQFAFKKLKTLDEKKAPEDPENLKEQAMYAARKSAGFLGNLGDSYYKKYEELKAKKRSKNSGKNS